MHRQMLPEEILSQLAGPDRELLLMIYRHRCLNTDLAWRHCYRAEGYAPGHVRRRLLELSERLELLAPAVYEAPARWGREACSDTAWFLTRQGVQTVRTLTGLPAWHARDPEGKHVLRVRTAGDLRVRDGEIAHQMGLNRFVLAFTARAGNRPCRYYDRLFMPACSGSMTPDGILVSGDTVFLLEQDMGTERGIHLTAKWKNYRTFLQHPGPFYEGKKLVMLFLLDRVTRTNARRNTLWRYLNECLLDQITGRFEAFADTPEHLIPLLLNRLIPDPELGVQWPGEQKKAEVLQILQEREGFTAGKPDLGEDLEYQALVRRETPGGQQTFLLDGWLDGELSVLHKICNHNRITAAFARRLPADGPVCYLVAVPDVEWAARVIGQAGLKEEDLARIRFLTPTRLQRHPFHEAVFQVDSLRCVYRFRDTGLQEAVFERKIH